MTDRCQRICGDDDNCFRGNDKQLACVSDMIINKASGIKAIIENARSGGKHEGMDEVLTLATRNLNELISWVVYLRGQRGMAGKKPLGIISRRVF